jgi:hypothetical protein
MAEPSKTPPPKDVMTDEMKQQVEDAKQAEASKKAYDKVSPIGKTIPPVEKKAKGGSIRGGGIESRGKTKGRFV